MDLVEAEDDGRPVILLGASMGGLLAAEVAARSPRVGALAVTCLLDPKDWRARVHMTRFGVFGVPGRQLSKVVRGKLAQTMIPINAIANLAKMSRSRSLSRRCANDPLGGAARVPVGFLASYMLYEHTSLQEVRVPMTLFHPSHDEWTPIDLSARLLAQAAGPSHLVVLRECGHFPIEEPGISDLVSGILDMAEDLAKGGT